MQPTKLLTVNLCLFEIHQIIGQLGPLEILYCNNVETWCDLKRFGFDLLQEQHLREFRCQFIDGGTSGFASIHSSLVNNVYPRGLTELQVACIRDEEQSEQRSILRVLDIPQYIGEEDDGIHRDQMLDKWHKVEEKLITKYQFFAHVRPTHVEFGFCYTWTSAVWDLMYSLCDELRFVSLHGWHQFWLFNQTLKDGDGMLLRSQAEHKINQCFSAMRRLETLELTDFYIGPGLLYIQLVSIRRICITFTDAFLAYIHGPEDVWKLMEPVKNFAATVFQKSSKWGKTLELNLHPELIWMIRQHPMFSHESFVDTLQSSLPTDVQLKFLGIC